FRAAVAKNDRLFPVYFELADLLLAQGQTDDADRLFRGVIRAAPDEELIARAARLSAQINFARGTLESLEQDLLPLAIANPQRPIYRRQLVDIYQKLTLGLVQRVRHGSPEDAEAARAALARIGARAIKPLLDALADQDANQQGIAIDVLAYVENANAALPLFAFATGPAEPALRARAMVACGALARASLLPKYEALLFPRDGQGDQAGVADAVAVAAVWGLARMRDPRTLPLLRRVARSGTPAMRALAALGLGMVHDRGSLADLTTMATSVDAGNVARAAAAYALGDLDAAGQAPTLLEIAEDGEPLPRRMALVALTRISAPDGKDAPAAAHAVQAMADAVFPDEPDGPRGRAEAEAVSRAGLAALAALATAGATSGDGRRAAAAARETLPVPDGALDVDRLLDGLVPPDPPPAEREAALLRFTEPIQRAALAALRTSGSRARAVLDGLGTGQGELLPFVARGSSGPAAAKAREIVAALEPSIVPLARHPDAAIRAKAIVLVARSSSDDALDAIAAALEDPNESVQRVALAAVAAPRTDGLPVHAGPRAVAAVTKILAAHESWAIRVLAARAMGRLGAAGAGAEARQRLSEAAMRDGYALVRQAALESLAAFDPVDARSLAARMAAADPEPRVEEAARAIASGPAGATAP
ncbi:MAG: HEAT repeat domain-containing protein, partial [Myxococcales bacterium]|nr:HEAT repeat domain-containing protein [Myxococcales bacterium]